MKTYQIQVVMPENKMNVARNDTRDLDVEQLDSTTLDLVRRAYPHDFDLMEGRNC